MHQPVTHDMIHKVVVTTLQVLPCKDSQPGNLPSLMTFLSKLVKYTNIYAGSLMATLVYLKKLKFKLPKNAHGLPCTRHRILLSCLILSSKFHNDSSPKNVHWAKYTDGLFSVKDINLMERQLLFLLNWDLKVTNEDMVDELESFLEPIKYDLVKSYKLRKFQQQKLKQQQQLQQQLLEQQKQHQRQLSYSSSSDSVPSSPESIMDSPNRNYRHDSSSSLSSILSDEVDPMIEFTAQKEQVELNKFLKQLNRSVDA